MVTWTPWVTVGSLFLYFKLFEKKVKTEFNYLKKIRILTANYNLKIIEMSF